MKVKVLILNMFLLACTIFAHIALVFDLIAGFSKDTNGLLSLVASAIIFIVAFMFSAVFVIFKEDIKLFSSKVKIICTISTFFTCISLALKILVTIINTSGKAHWETSVFSIISILAFSVIISVCINFLRLKNLAINALIYFFLIGIFYYLITVTIGGLDTGNNLILILGIYLGAYTLGLIVVLTIKHLYKSKMLKNKSYKKQF